MSAPSACAARTSRQWCLGLPAAVCAFLALGAGPDTGDEKPWAFQPVVRPEIPRCEVATPNPIDAFVNQNLNAHNLKPAPQADKRTLVRRLSFDLVGLPPAPEEVEQFLADTRPDAYERLVDRLLASPHYGERWGRHWLDLVRYAETHGYERDDPKPDAWRYRDWVIRAFNRDIPYDRFLVEQLAGDELPDSSPETRTATGMYRLGQIDDEPADPVMDRFDQLDDYVRTVGTTMLGLTIQCARCHDHKFDPIPQADYYRLLSFFAPSQPFVRDDNSSITTLLASPEDKERFDEETSAINKRLIALKEQIETLRAPHRKELIAEAEGKLDNDTLAAIQTPSERRDAMQKELADKAKPHLKPTPEAVDARLTEEEKTKKAELDRQIAAIEPERPAPLPRALALADRPRLPDPTKLLIRGDAHRPGAEVTPGFLSAIDSSAPSITPLEGNKSTGRRLALARWIARAENPLTARVMVNRLWQHHFGQGIVASPSDFGAMGEEASNPALLDWLAAEFVARGWSMKAMHRLMVTSAAYKRSDAWNEEAAKLDPTGAWLWRMTPRRLDAEPIRDAALAVSGVLNLEIGGPSVTPPIDKAVLAGQSRPGNGWGKADERSASRRSIYVFVKRTLPLPELELLDSPDNADPCPRRAVTTTAPQALALLNSAFWHDQAAHFTERLRREAGDSPGMQVERAFWLALARAPSERERSDALEFLDAQLKLIKQRTKSEGHSDPRVEALRAFCLVLLNTNEFVTVD